MCRKMWNQLRCFLIKNNLRLDLSSLWFCFGLVKKKPRILVGAIDYLLGGSMQYKVIAVNDGSKDDIADFLNKFSSIAYQSTRA